VKLLLETLREKNQGKYKLLKQIDHLIPLYDAHDFWDS
jgi:glycylpeptide N-tetradecanoyltransferase